LGVITGISILCPPKPKAKNLAFLGLNDYPNILKAFSLAKEYLGEILSGNSIIFVSMLIEAFEFVDNHALHHSIAHSGASYPLDETYKFNVLIETSGSNTEHDAAKLQNYLEHVLEKQIISDGVLAESETQLTSLWSIREGVTEGLGHAGGGVYKYDLSMPLELLYTLVEETRQRVKGVNGIIDVVGYGHIGDGNLHLNVVVDKFSPDIEKVLEPWVYEWIRISYHIL
jgi:(R)-2-hydroxyglutarate---pyruvate transhydrogenase